MLIRNSLALLIGLLTIFISCTSVYINAKIVDKNNLLLDDKLSETEAEHRHTKALYAASIVEKAKRLSVVYNSQLSEEQLRQSMQTNLAAAHLEHVWFFDDAGIQTAGYNSITGVHAPPLFFMGATAVDSIIKKAPYHFVEFIQGNYYELYADVLRDAQQHIAGVVIVSKKIRCGLPERSFAVQPTG